MYPKPSFLVPPKENENIVYNPEFWSNSLSDFFTIPYYFFLKKLAKGD
jgi:hypothetical protein